MGGSHSGSPPKIRIPSFVFGLDLNFEDYSRPKVEIKNYGAWPHSFFYLDRVSIR